MKLICLTCALGIIPAAVASNERGPCDLMIFNGTILTFDDQGTKASAIEITGNVITAVWLDDPDKSDCAQSIDLDGRTVIPGLIDNHVHWLARAYRPGHNVAEMDNAFSWPEAVQILLRKMSEVPEVGKGKDATADNFITAIGGITPTQFIEGILPDLATLDGIDRPVLLSPGFNGPSQTNTAGIAYFAAHGVTVAGDGSITAGNTTAARNALSSEHDFDDQVRGTLDLMAWSASVGLTTVVNFSDNSSAAQTLFDDGTAFTRLRHNLGSQNLAQVPNIIQQLLESDGDDMFRLALLGEFVVGGQGVPPDYDDAALLMAEAGVSHHQHAIPDSDADGFLDVWETVNNVFPIIDLRWQLAHVFNMSAGTMNRLHALGGGFAMQTQNYAGTLLFTDDGPPFRSAYDHASLRASTGTDGGNLVTINPWLAIYFMTTGLNDAGDMRVPPGETITVTEAIELYTTAASWFSFDEAKLGSLEVGKLADLAVLSADVLALEAQGRPAALRDVTSVLTIVDGDIVYSDGTLVQCADSNEYGQWYRRTGDGVCAFGSNAITPDGFEAFRGFHASGTLDDVLESDDSDLCFNPGIVLNPTEAPVTLDFVGTLPNDSPASLEVTIESSANTVGLELTISFWNFNTNSWDIVGTATQALNTDTVRTFAGTPADHVEASTGFLVTRYEVRQVSFIFVYPWLDCVDHVFWTTTN